MTENNQFQNQQFQNQQANQQNQQAQNQGQNQAVDKQAIEEAEGFTIVNGKKVPLEQARAAMEQEEQRIKTTGIRDVHNNQTEPVQSGQKAEQQTTASSASARQSEMNVKQGNVQSGQKELEQAMNGTQAQQQTQQQQQAAQGINSTKTFSQAAESKAQSQSAESKTKTARANNKQGE